MGTTLIINLDEDGDIINVGAGVGVITEQYENFDDETYGEDCHACSMDAGEEYLDDEDGEYEEAYTEESGIIFSNCTFHIVIGDTAGM